MSKYPMTVFVMIPTLVAGLMAVILCGSDFLHQANILFPF